jgi:hypothetical protein
LAEVIKRVAALANLDYRVESHAVYVFRSGAQLDGPSPEIPGSGADASDKTMPADKLGSIIIPRIYFRQASVREACEFLTKRSIELDPEHIGVKFVMNFDKLQPAGTSTVTGNTEAPLPPDKGSITFDLYNIPVSEGIKYMARIAELEYRIEGHTVYLSEQTRPSAPSNR